MPCSLSGVLDRCTATRGEPWSLPPPPPVDFRGRAPGELDELAGRRTADIADIVRVRVWGGRVLIVLVVAVVVVRTNRRVS